MEPARHERWRAADAALPDGRARRRRRPEPRGGNPPLYYLFEAPAYARRERRRRVRPAARHARSSSLLWLLVTVTAVWLLAGEVFGRDRLLQLAAASVAGLAPMVTFLSASVTPDAMMYALWSLALWLGVRILRRGLTWPLALALFALAGAAGMRQGDELRADPGRGVRARGRAVAPAPPARARGLASAGRRRRRARADARRVEDRGERDGARDVGAVQRRHLDASDVLNVRMLLSYVWQFYLPRLPFQDDFAFPGPTLLPLDAIWLQGAWGAFGWLEVDFPPIVYDVLIAVTAIVVFAAAHRRSGARGARSTGRSPPSSPA